MGLALGGACGAIALAMVANAPPMRRAAGRIARRVRLLPPDPRATAVPPLAADDVDARTLAVDTLRGRVGRADWAGAAEIHAGLAQEAFVRAHRTARAWVERRSPGLGLLPRRQSPGTRDYVWSYRDSASDCFPHLVIAAFLLDAELLPPLRSMLETERRLSGALPQSVDLETGAARPEDVDERIFGAVEYAKDGLLPIAERVGAPEWASRLDEVVSRVLAASPVTSRFGPLPSATAEKNGEMLQVLGRLYQRTRRPEYLEAGRRISDAYCNEVLPGNGGLPAEVWDFERHRAVSTTCVLRDHGNEAIAGLVEWLIAELVTPASRAEQLRPAIERMLSVLLERGRGPDGLWLQAVDPFTELPRDPLTAAVPNDNWGYVSSAFVAYALTLPDASPLRQRCLAAARKSLRAVTRYRSARWEWGEFDGYADTIEGALYVLEYLDDPEAEYWVDREIGVLFAYQQADGLVGGTYLDGNFVRTALLYGLFRTAGVVPEPWVPALRVGACRAPDGLYLHVESSAAWQGRLRFDTPRHRELMGLAMSYPRLNAWPEWFVTETDSRYELTDLDTRRTRTVTGADLRAGLPLSFSPSGAAHLRIRRR